MDLKKLKWKTNNKFFILDLKERTKSNDYFHVIAKARFHVRYFCEDKKICSCQKFFSNTKKGDKEDIERKDFALQSMNQN